MLNMEAMPRRIEVVRESLAELKKSLPKGNSDELLNGYFAGEVSEEELNKVIAWCKIKNFVDAIQKELELNA